jgi:hypothetical protein
MEAETRSSGSAVTEPRWLSDWKTGHASRIEALARFDALEGVQPEAMIGRWRGMSLVTGHPLDGLLEELGWYGKAFESLDRMHPLLFRDALGELTALDASLMPVSSEHQRRLERIITTLPSSPRPGRWPLSLSRGKPWSFNNRWRTLVVGRSDPFRSKIAFQERGDPPVGMVRRASGRAPLLQRSQVCCGAALRGVGHMGARLRRPTWQSSNRQNRSDRHNRLRGRRPSACCAISAIIEGRHGLRIKLHDKLAALRLLGLELGMFKEKAEIDADSSLRAIVEAVH